MNTHIRHLLATSGYRFDRVCQGAPHDFAGFAPAQGAMTALDLLNHMVNALSFAEAVITETNRITWKTSSWIEGQHQFRFVLNELDEFLRDNQVDDETLDMMIQGPFCDLLFQLGQLALMRRLHGKPMPRENYLRAAIRPSAKMVQAARA